MSHAIRSHVLTGKNPCINQAIHLLLMNSFLESIISRLATSEISIFLLVSVTEETGLSLALSETPKTGFVASRPKFQSDLLPKHANGPRSKKPCKLG